MNSQEQIRDDTVRTLTQLAERIADGTTKVITCKVDVDCKDTTTDMDEHRTFETTGYQTYTLLVKGVEHVSD